jgi:sterol desaturase/sphingolipid hydroxylase (fatty acid hydroxylase superfamily)
MLWVRGWITHYASYLATALLALATVFAVLILLEVVAPRGAQPSLHSRLKSLTFWTSWYLLSAILMIPGGYLLGQVTIHPLIPSLVLSPLPHAVGVLLGAIVAAVLGDFVYYWTHRAQHSVPFLWRFHATHHSVREMSAVTGYHHVAEPAIGAFIYGLPLSLLVRDPAVMPLAGGITTVLGHYLHSTTRLHFGPFWRLIVDNRFHRIHHSLEPHHFGRNFGVVTPVWDVVFGTAYFPKRDEWPDTGLADRAEPQSVGDYILQPLRPRRHG